MNLFILTIYDTAFLNIECEHYTISYFRGCSLFGKGKYKIF